MSNSNKYYYIKKQNIEYSKDVLEGLNISYNTDGNATITIKDLHDSYKNKIS